MLMTRRWLLGLGIHLLVTQPQALLCLGTTWAQFASIGPWQRRGRGQIRDAHVAPMGWVRRLIGWRTRRCEHEGTVGGIASAAEDSTAGGGCPAWELPLAMTTTGFGPGQQMLRSWGPQPARPTVAATRGAQVQKPRAVGATAGIARTRVTTSAGWHGRESGCSWQGSAALLL